MSAFLQCALSAAGGYLLGAVPVGYLVARANGVNIFEHGSKNPGATNVKRVVGGFAGNLTFALDALKGALAARWLHLASLAGAECVNREQLPAAAVAGLAGAMLGHSFSVFTGFRGGKGVATAAGGLIVLLPVPTIIALAVWGVVFKASLYVSLASMVAALTLVAGSWWPGTPLGYSILTTCMGALVILRHRANIARLAAGTEHKFERKKPGA
ncbi:MAG: glycerol-3-phosphate 1-O-acyltransferase PlsY [Opitutaceae bacterium]|jgi:glycerol-3-phosphate acyltransferase PlsY|nr:glycerol-3-phosphate 1-O-acyltransferase PlsY [Opitutaceae bacterium]